MNQTHTPGVEQLQLLQNEINKIDNDFFETIQFSLLTEDDIIELSSLDITLNDIRNNYRSEFRTGIEIIDDNPLLGTTDPKKICPTCNRNGSECEGHYSTIELPFYIPNPNYLKEISFTLNCICMECSSLKLTNYEKFQMRKIAKSKRLEYMSGILFKKGLCDNCSKKYKDDITPFKYIQFKPRNINGTNFIISLVTFFGKKQSETFCYVNYNRLYFILSKMKREDIKFIGFGENNTKDLMLKKILVIPPNTRPKMQDGNSVYIDGLTRSYSNIFRTIAIFLQKNIRDTIMSDCSRKLQNMNPVDINGNAIDISDLIDIFLHENIILEKVSVLDSIQNLYNAITPKKSKGQSSDSALELSFRNKLDGKFGILRRVMMGKRVNHSARSVVGPSPDFDINEIGVPKFIAQNLSVRVNVTNINYNSILDLQKHKKIKSIIKTKNGIEKRLIEDNTTPISIKIGDIIERELINGDYVLANRNPTIQKQGMIGLRAKIIDENIFRLNLALTTAFNADFDGDELNIHVPQTLDALAELSTFVSAEGCYGNQQQSSIMVGLVFDAVTGSFILSQDFIYIPPDDFHQCVFNANMPDDFVNDVKNYNYGTSFIKTKKKYNKCIEIVFNYLYIYVNNKFSEEIIKQIYEDLSNFEEKLSNIDNTKYETDYQYYFQQPLNESYILDQLIIIYFKNPNDHIYKDIINLFLQKQFLESQIKFKIDLTKNETQYLYLFIDKISFYCSLKESLIEDQSYIDNEEHYFDQCLKNNVDIYSGKSLFSTILPVMQYEKFKKGANQFENYINRVKINKGILKQGWLNKEHVGANTNSIPHLLFLYKDPTVVSFFLTYAQRLINHYFLTEGFTIGVHDCMLDDALKVDIAEKINRIRSSAATLERNVYSYDENEKEEKIIQNLQNIRLLNEVVIKSLDVRSPLLIMAELAKAKGKGANLVQIMAAIGQQYYGGTRIKNDTPYYKENDPDPMAKGLCVNSFIQGMTPSEFVYHMYSSREGLVEGAIKTGDCGAMHHNIAKVLEVLIVREDKTVRNTQKRVIQFIYGEDGFDAEEMQRVKIGENTYTSFMNIQYIADSFNNTV